MTNINSLSEDINWHFPEKAPRIGIKPVSADKEASRVELMGDPFHFGAFQPDDEFAVCDYDLPDENLTQVTRGLTRGPINFQGRNCTEILCREFTPEGELMQLVRRFVSWQDRFGTILFVSSRRPNGMGTVELTELQFPLIVEPRARWNVIRNSGINRPGTPVKNIERITGQYDVFLGKDRKQCLRWLRPRTTEVGFREADEIFVDVTSGLTVLLRGFIGKGYPDLESYQRSPKLEIGGEIFYLRYIRRVIRQQKVLD